MSNTKEVHSKPRLHVSQSTCYLKYGRHVARLRRRRRRRRAYAPTSNTASHDNHEKISSWVSFCFPYMGCLWGSAWQPFGPLELRYYQSRDVIVTSCYTIILICKMWNEQMLWLAQMMGYNAYIPLLTRQMNDVGKIHTLQFLMSLLRSSFSANYSMHEMDTHHYKT